ncbi:hypothetical protein [Paraburkholderia kirstenboschensis]|uniref:hypothetical protein n=1 Tax=Paraburkholderia kirstenboschensis TaxID=1245436 RepID=UPI000FFCB4F6|nr:hypothetical protein [Paraburkholderia kirstenboschensis]
MKKDFDKEYEETCNARLGRIRIGKAGDFGRPRSLSAAKPVRCNVRSMGRAVKRGASFMRRHLFFPTQRLASELALKSPDRCETIP